MPFDCKTAVFYVNTCDGYTEFEECGTRVESVAGRIVIFPSQLSILEQVQLMIRKGL